jgi:chitinase
MVFASNLLRSVLVSFFILCLFSECKKTEDTPIPAVAAELENSSSENRALNTPIVLGYFPSWSENWVSATTINQSKLVSLPSTVTHVFLAFAKPNLTYIKGSYSLTNTGIEVPYDGNTLKLVVDAAKAKGIQVILSVGGETYWQSAAAYTINYQQIKDLVDDIGFAGIDWDFEPNGSFQDIGSPLNVSRYIGFVNQSRALMPRSAGYLIACAPAGAGALGGLNNNDTLSPYAYHKRNLVTGESDQFLYAFSDPTKSISLFGFSSTGHMIPVLKAVGDKIDIVAYQGYNTGAAPNRWLMYDAYAYYANQYGFKIAAGIHIPNEPWGPYYTFNTTNTVQLVNHIKNGGAHNRQNTGDGIMMWQLLMNSALNAAENGVTYANLISQTFSGTGGGTGTNPPAPPIVNQTAITLGSPITGSVTSAGTLQILKAGTQISTQTVATGNWSYTPTTTGTYTFKLSANGLVSATSAVVVVNAPTGGGGTGGGTGGCGYAAYNSTLSYPTAGTRVFHLAKIYESKWWVNPGEVPDYTNPYGPWLYIQDCTSTPTAPSAPTVNQTSITLGAPITGTVAAAGTLLILKAGVQIGTQAVSVGAWTYTPTSTGSYTFKITANTLTSAASAAVNVVTATAPAAPTVNQTSVTLGAPITGTVAAAGTLLILKAGVQIGTQAVNAGAWTYTPTSTGSYTFKITANSLTSVASVAVNVVAGTAPAAPTVNQTSITLGAPITGNVAAAGTLLILKAGVQVATKAVNAGAWTYTPTSTGSYTFKITANTLTSAASAAVNVVAGTAPAAPTVNQTSITLGGTITGSVTVSGTLRVYKAGVQVTTFSVNAGNWSYAPTTTGVYTFKITANNLTSAASPSVNVTAAATPPAAPAVGQTSIALGAPITGTAAAAGTLLIFKAGVQVGSQATSAGAWTYTPTSAGVYTFKLSVNGLVSAASSAVTVTSPSSGTTCGYSPYQASLSYPIVGTRVYYQAKIYESKWWVNPNEVPDPNNPWGPWKFIQNCP